MKNNTVGLIYLHFFSVHDNGSLFQIHRKESHGIGFVIQRNEMLLKRHCNVFSVNSTIETYTKNELILRSDVVITAVGRMDFLTPNMIDGKWSSEINGYENTGSSFYVGQDESQGFLF